VPHIDPDQLIPFVETIATGLCAQLEPLRLAAENKSEPADQRLVNEAMNHCLAGLSSTEVWGKANQIPSQAFWKIAGDLVNLGSLQWHARAKPRGYAGDFEMLHNICTDYCCDHPVGQRFDRFFQDHAAPQAVRNRYQLVGEEIVRQVRVREPLPLHVVSVGSGPAADIQHAARLLSGEERTRLMITLLDIDPSALDFCKSQLASWFTEEQVRYRQENLHRVGRRRATRELLESADMIVCVGLFDYLETARAKQMLEVFWRSLPPQGKLMVFNFSPDNPSRTYMEWLGNWYLIYRTSEELREIANAAGIPDDDQRIDAEAAGVNLFLSANKR
jgi:extracellular factor (EF) 3-hydroxypalmitic acid methyl ester biosynthesis protein